MKKITLSGLAGSGKSTVGKLLANKLGCRFISAGEISRQFATEKYGVDINTFQKICSEKPSIDVELDKYFEQQGQKLSNFVMDYRLGSLFIQDGYHIFLDVSNEEAARRIKMSERGNEFLHDDFNHKLQQLNERNKLMRERFMKLYNFDFTDHKNYHLVINTNIVDVNGCVENVLKSIKY